MKNILYIESAPQAGGSTVSLFQLVERLDRRRFEPVVLLCCSNPYASRFASLGVRVITTDQYCSLRTPVYPPALAQARQSKWASCMRSNRVTRALWHAAGLAIRTVSRTWPLARHVQRIIEQNRIDLVHLNDAQTLHKAGILGSRFAHVPCICHARSLQPLDALDRLLARYVAYHIFISRAVEHDQRRRGLGQREGSVVYNGLDLSSYHSLDRQTARRAFGVKDTDLVVGMVGRIEPWKGHRDLLAALSSLAPQWPALRCLIAGAPERDGLWYQQELESLVDSLHLRDVVQFVGFQENVPQVMAALDLLVHASIQPEPFGRVLIEGMAAGLPVVATDAGGVPEIVVDGQTGLLVPPGHPLALATAVDRLLSDRTQAIIMGQKGRERASALFTIESHVRAIENIYQTVIH